INRGGVPVAPPSSSGGRVVLESRLGLVNLREAWFAHERTPRMSQAANSPVVPIGPQVAVAAVGVTMVGGTVPPTSHLPVDAKVSLVLAKHFALPVIQLAPISNPATTAHPAWA